VGGTMCGTKRRIVRGEQPAKSAAASMSERRALLTIRSLHFAAAHSECGIPSNSRSDALIVSAFSNARAGGEISPIAWEPLL
jgi:hypothetical protein